MLFKNIIKTGKHDYLKSDKPWINPNNDKGEEIDSFWTDSRVLKFYAYSMQGQYGIYKGCKSKEAKMKRFKEVELQEEMI